MEKVNISALATAGQRVLENVEKVIVGKSSVVELVLVSIFCEGHVLLEDVPGIGKTMMARAVARSLGCSFHRIQSTPDLLPSDITGSYIFNQKSGEFEFRPGPVFSQVLLADEINRATPRTQSALLEAMEERQVTVEGDTRPLPRPFIVLATQNPIEMEGTYPLPEAQQDRFARKILFAPPTEEEISEILLRTTGPEEPGVSPVAGAEDVLRMQAVVRRIAVASHVRQYVARLVAATHPDHPAAPPRVRSDVRYGASPRGAQAILLAAKVAAAREGRANVAFDDVRQAVPSALRHRLILRFEALAEGATTEETLRELLEQVRPDD